MFRIAAAAALLLIAVDAGAQQTTIDSQEALPFRLVFTSSTPCRSPKEFEDQLRGRTNRLRRATAVEPGLTLFVDLLPTEAGVEGQLGMRKADGSFTERAVPGADCHEVISAMALIAALMADMTILPNAAVEPRKGPQWHWGFALGQRLNAHTGIMPGLAWGSSLQAELDYVREGLFQPGVRLAGHFSQATKSAETSPSSLGSAEFEWRALRLSLCPVNWAPVSRLSIRPCVFGDVGRLKATGFQTEAARAPASVDWWGWGAELAFEVAVLAPLTVGGEIGFLGPGVSDSFSFVPTRRPGATIYQIGSAGLVGGLGVGLRFF